MNSPDYEVAVIGGGPAGSIAAISLKEMGIDVCLIEKKKFPRETICGEFLSGEVVYYLKQFDLYNEFLALNPNPIKSFRLNNKNGTEITAKLNFHAFGLRRSVLDSFLIKAAECRGVHVLQPAEVKELRNNDGSVTLNITDEINNPQFFRAKYVISACGKHSRLDKNFDRDLIHQKSSLNGIKFHFPPELIEDYDKEEINIYLDDGIYCGVNAVDNNIITVSALEKRDNGNISLRGNLIRMISGNKKFRKIFKAGYEDFINSGVPCGVANLYLGKKGLVKNRIFHAGDSAGIISPVTGDGISMAFQSAVIVSNILSGVHSGIFSLKEAEKIYLSRWNARFRNRIWLAHLLQIIILSKAARNPGISLLYKFPGVLPYLIKKTRG